MSVAPVYQTQAPPSPTRLGGWLIAKTGVPRRLLAVCRNAYEDISACLSESRDDDAEHDDALVLADELAARGVQIAAVNGCPCGARYRAIRRAIKTAQAADEHEDRLIDAAWCVARRLAGAIGRALTMRKQARP